MYLKNIIPHFDISSLRKQIVTAKISRLVNQEIKRRVWFSYRLCIFIGLNPKRERHVVASRDEIVSWAFHTRARKYMIFRLRTRMNLLFIHSRNTYVWPYWCDSRFITNKYVNIRGIWWNLFYVLLQVTLNIFIFISENIICLRELR